MTYNLFLVHGGKRYLYETYTGTDALDNAETVAQTITEGDSVQIEHEKGNPIQRWFPATTIHVEIDEV